MSRQTSLDSLRKHVVSIRQPEKGYRFSLDALLLADFARLPSQAVVADLGTGCGVIPLVLARRNPTARFVGFESNPEMAALACENVSGNGLEGQVEIVSDDILNIRPRFPVSSFDAVISNPPFRSACTGKTSPLAGRDTARHESTAGLSVFLAAAKYLVKPGGRICFIQHPSRLAEFVVCAQHLKLALLRLRMVHGTREGKATMFLAELAKGSRGGLTVEPPLILRDEGGEYSNEVAEMIGEQAKKTSGVSETSEV